MLRFPALKTGAVIQYPGHRQTRFSTQVIEFLDGTEQRFREYAGPLMRWVIQLDKLDAGELQEAANFFDGAGPTSTFSFTDPWDGTVHANCVVEGNEFQAKVLDEWRGQTQITIRENRT
jgi:hypothetical protein